MRRLLLSTVAALVGATGLAGVASAQTGQATNWSVVAGSAASPPAPGTAVVNLNVLFNGHVGVYSASGNTTATQKFANYNLQTFFRLFFNMNGQTTNGILYGATSQFRENSPTPSNGGSGRGASTVYLNNASAYIGTATAGKLYFGNGYGSVPASLFSLGYFDGFDAGGWNGDINGFVNGGANVTYPWFDDSFIYAPDKISYFSPKFAGFDFGLSYEPNYVSDGEGSSQNISSSTLAADAGKRRNTLFVSGRYNGTFGPVGVAASGTYVGGGVVNYTGLGQRYRGLELGQFGTEITIGGLDFGGNILYGYQNGGGISLDPVGGVKSTAYTVGAQYTVGPVLVGASLIEYWSQGAYDPTDKALGQRNEWGIAVGGTYALTPGFGFYLSYIYGQRKQNGYDLINSAESTLNNQTRASVAGLGVYAQW